MATTTETMFEDILTDALLEADVDDFKCIETFEEAGLMTNNKGVVVKMSDGTEFQVTIVQSR